MERRPENKRETVRDIRKRCTNQHHTDVLQINYKVVDRQSSPSATEITIAQTDLRKNEFC